MEGFLRGRLGVLKGSFPLTDIEYLSLIGRNFVLDDDLTEGCALAFMILTEKVLETLKWLERNLGIDKTCYKVTNNHN